MKYKLTPRALLGLSTILLEVEERFGPRVADRTLNRFQAAFERVAEQPTCGHVRDDLTHLPGILFVAVGPSLVAYRMFQSTVQILFIERGARDWKRFL